MTLRPRPAILLLVLSCGLGAALLTMSLRRGERATIEIEEDGGAPLGNLPRSAVGSDGPMLRVRSGAKDGMLEHPPSAHKAELVIAPSAWPDGFRSQSWIVRGVGDRAPGEQVLVRASTPAVLDSEQPIRLNVSFLLDEGSAPAALEVTTALSVPWVRARLQHVREVANATYVAEYHVVTLRADEGGAWGHIADRLGSSIGGVRVGLFLIKDGIPNRKPRETTTSDAAGVYRIDGLAPGLYLVAATSDGFSPQGTAARVQAGGLSRADLRLLVGHSAEVTVSCRGQCLGGAMGILRHHVADSPTSAPRRILRLGAKRLSWNGGDAVYPTEISNRADQGGRILVEHLPAANYSMQLIGFPGLLFLMSRSSELVRIVSIPEPAIAWNIDAALCVITVISNGKPVVGASVTLESTSGGTTGTTGKDGKSEFFVSPGTSLRLAVEQGHILETRTLHTPDRAVDIGQITVDLDESDELCRVEVRLTDSNSRPIDRISARLQYLNADPDQPPAAAKSELLESASGIYELAARAPGRYLLSIVPGAGREPDLANFYLSVRKKIVIGHGHQSFLFRALKGGRLRISQLGRSGRPSRANCRIRRIGAATDLPMRYRTKTVGGYRIGPSPLPGGWPSVTAEPLPPGDYQISVGPPGGEGTSIEVVVIENRTKDVVVGAK